jgi:hypothetical protein
MVDGLEEYKQMTTLFEKYAVLYKEILSTGTQEEIFQAGEILQELKPTLDYFTYINSCVLQSNA